MKLSELRRLLLEDYPSQQSWIGDLLLTLNLFMEQVFQALNRGLTITDNLDAQLNEVTFIGNSPVTFKISLRNRPKGVLVSNVLTVSGTAPTAAVQPAAWAYNSSDQTITISSWHGGLDSSAKYTITLYTHAS